MFLLSIKVNVYYVDQCFAQIQTQIAGLTVIEETFLSASVKLVYYSFT